MRAQPNCPGLAAFKERERVAELGASSRSNVGNSSEIFHPSGTIRGSGCKEILLGRIPPASKAKAEITRQSPQSLTLVECVEGLVMITNLQGRLLFISKACAQKINKEG